MANVIEFDFDAVYRAWRVYMIRYTETEHYGMLFDPTKQAEFPYANLKVISRPKNGGDLEGDEASISVTIEVEGYINNTKYNDLYKMDSVSAKFFAELGFGRVGSSEPIKVSETVTKITSRYYMPHYCGFFLRDLGSL